MHYSLRRESCNVKDSEKEILDLFVHPDLHPESETHPPSQRSQKSIQSFVCNPAGKQTATRMLFMHR